MRIRDIFATAVQERIEPVVKVADRRPTVVQRELANLVVTPQWEEHLYRMLDAYVDAAAREDEKGIGLWISGFFGCGEPTLAERRRVEQARRAGDDNEAALATARIHELEEFAGRLRQVEESGFACEALDDFVAGEPLDRWRGDERRWVRAGKLPRCGWMDDSVPESPAWTALAPERESERVRLEEKRKTALGQTSADTA